jgi:hypothetical protein
MDCWSSLGFRACLSLQIRRLRGASQTVAGAVQVVYTRIFDLKHQRKGCASYFLPSVAAYSVGLVLTYGALLLQIGGQQVCRKRTSLLPVFRAELLPFLMCKPFRCCTPSWPAEWKPYDCCRPSWSVKCKCLYCCRSSWPVKCKPFYCCRPSWPVKCQPCYCGRPSWRVKCQPFYCCRSSWPVTC